MALSKTKKADIKRRQRRYFETSLLISLIMIAGAFKFFPSLEKKTAILEANAEVVTIEDIDPTRHQLTPPAPPRPPIVIEAPDAPDVDTPLGDTDVDPDATFRPPVKPPTDTATSSGKNDELLFFDVVEDDPQIVGGLTSIQEHLVYPDLAARAGVEGTVVIRAYIDKTGAIVKTEFQRTIGGGCDEAALDAVMKATFVPGMQRGKPVPVKMSIPIRFRLKGE